MRLLAWSILLAFMFVSCGQDSQSSSSAPNSVVGQDDRRPMYGLRYPWSAIGKLKVGGSSCTATVIGEDLVLTAAHCMFTREGRRRSDLFSFEANYYEGDSLGFRIGYLDDARWGSRYWQLGVQYDWAILRLSRPLSDKVTPLSVRIRAVDRNNRLVLPGYSSDFHDGKIAGIDHNCRGREINAEVVEHNCDTFRGASGAPILWRENRRRYSVVGVHSSGIAEDEGDSLNTGASARKFYRAYRGMKGSR